MKKLLLGLLFVGLSSVALAKHYFEICYYNWSSNPITYNNEGRAHGWSKKGLFTGQGTVSPGAHQCVQGYDETIFFTDYTTFSVSVNDHTTRLGLLNKGGMRYPAFVVAPNGGGSGEIQQAERGGRDYYVLYVHILNDGTIVTSNSHDQHDVSAYIQPLPYPRAF